MLAPETITGGGAKPVPMADCDVCGREEGMPYRCRFCGGTFCGEHRLPENHQCPGLEEWNDPTGVFGQQEQQQRSRVDAARQRVTSRGGIMGYFRGNMTYVFLGLMWVFFLLEAVVLYGLRDGELFGLLFTLQSAHIPRVWTWFTSIFAHNPYGFMHIFFNSIVLYFFGPVVERRVGTRRFTALFLVAGVIAGLAQVGTAAFIGEQSAVLGASGAIMALMGVLTVLNPNLRIYLYFIIPMPLWVATLLFAIYSVFMSSVGGIGAGNVAQLAHLAGLAIGLAYGTKLKQEGTRAPERLQFGGGGGRGGRRRF